MRPPVWESSSRPQVAAEGLLEIRKEAFLFEKAGHCKKVYRLFQNSQERDRENGSCSPSGEVIPKKRGTLGLMTLNFYSPKSPRLVFIAFILICLVFSGTAFGKKKKSSSGRSARSSKSKKVTARNRSSRRGGRQVARSSRRRGGRLEGVEEVGPEPILGPGLGKTRSPELVGDEQEDQHAGRDERPSDPGYDSAPTHEGRG